MPAPPTSSPAHDVVRGRLAVAAALTIAAGVVHVAAAVPHFGDDTLLGSAFTITGWAQIVVAALLLRRQPSRAAAWAASDGAAATTTDERVHVHDDDTIHVHAAGDGHEHDDGTVHVHAAAPDDEPTVEETASDSHTHAPGEGH